MGLENTWFNTSVFENMTKDPRPIFWMVAASVITATLTTIFIGKLTDRTRSKCGRGKHDILLGYILWGLRMAVFPLNAMLALGIIVSSMGYLLFGQFRSVPLLAFVGVLWQAFYVAISIASVTWLKDFPQEESWGRFLGMRMVFWVALPMLIGPVIGSALIRRFGIPATLNGESGYIPGPVIFRVEALISLFALIPLFFLKDQESPLVNIIKVGADQ